MSTWKLALSLLHPGPFQLITVTPNFLMTYYVDNFYGLKDRYEGGSICNENIPVYPNVLYLHTL